MNIFNYGSIEVKSLKMQEILSRSAKFDRNVLTFIIGESGTGKSMLAKHIQVEVFKNQGVAILDGASIFSFNPMHGICTLTSEEWAQLSDKIEIKSIQLIEMPTLAQRRADIPQLAEFFLQVLSLMNNKPKIKLTEKSLEKILQYNWPGQFTEFENTLESAFMAADSGIIEPECLVMGPLKTNVGIPAGMKLEELERKYILQTLYFAHQNRTKTAEILGISIRTLRNKINQYRVEGFI